MSCWLIQGLPQLNVSLYSGLSPYHSHKSYYLLQFHKQQQWFWSISSGLRAQHSSTEPLCLCWATYCTWESNPNSLPLPSELGGPVYFHWTTLLTSCNMGFKYTIPGTPGLILSPKTRIVGERWIGYSKLSCDMNVMITPVFLWTLIHLGAVDLYRIYQTSQDIVVFRAWPLSST